MTSQKFKQELKKEAKQWQVEGLITKNIYESLAQRYQFTNLTANSNNLFTAVIITFGCILLGLAVITFVAANWQAWSKSIKVAILISSFLITNIAGFYTWQKATVNWQSRLGQGLLLLGSLILGANIGLMSQIFHQTGAVYQLFLVWGFSVLLMAHGLQLASLGIIAIILISIGYFSGLSSSIFSEMGILVRLMPILVSCLFISLAYRCRSRWLFFLSSCLTIIAFNVAILDKVEIAPISLRFFLLVVSIVIPIAWLWGYQDKPTLLNFAVPISFISLSRKLAIFNLSLLLYVASFHGWWDSLANNITDLTNNWFYPDVLLNILLFGIVTLYWWWQLGKSKTNNKWRLDSQSLYIAIAIISSSILLSISVNITPLGFMGTVYFNLLLFILSLILIREALKSEKRLGYWSGIFLLSIQVSSRMFEYNTGLLVKSLVLFICGLAVIFAGIWFEKKVFQSRPES